MLSSSAATTSQKPINPYARTTVRDPWAPNLDNPLLCSPDARRLIEERRLQGTDMPSRFVDPNVYTHTIKKEHPFYRTSNNEYGAHKPTQMDFPSAYFSTSKNFTKVSKVSRSKAPSVSPPVLNGCIFSSLQSFNCNVYTSQSLTTAAVKKPLGHD